MMKQQQKATIRAFTLVEVLAVVSIIAILTSLSYAYLIGARREGRDQVRASTIEQLKLAFKIIKEENPTGSHPTCNLGVELGVGNITSCLNGLNIDALIKNIYPHLKPDVLNTTGAGGTAYGYWYDSNFRCTNNNNPAQKVLLTRLESAANSNYTSVCTYTPVPAMPNNWPVGSMYVQLIQ